MDVEGTIEFKDGISRIAGIYFSGGSWANPIKKGIFLSMRKFLNKRLGIIKYSAFHLYFLYEPGESFFIPDCNCHP